jgi:hypothetical protein
MVNSEKDGALALSSVAKRINGVAIQRASRGHSHVIYLKESKGEL